MFTFTRCYSRFTATGADFSYLITDSVLFDFVVDLLRYDYICYIRWVFPMGGRYDSSRYRCSSPLRSTPPLFRSFVVVHTFYHYNPFPILRFEGGILH